MSLQDICTTLETSRKLKEAGFPQENGIAYWCADLLQGWLLLSKKEAETYNCMDKSGYVRAWFFNELWEILPREINTNGLQYTLVLFPKEIGYLSVGFLLKGCPTDDGECSGACNCSLISIAIRTKPQEAAAELALWCVKEGYLNPKETWEDRK